MKEGRPVGGMEIRVVERVQRAKGRSDLPLWLLLVGCWVVSVADGPTCEDARRLIENWLAEDKEEV